MSVLLDSDIVIEVLRARDQLIVSQWNALKTTNSAILVSPVTVAEVWAGSRPSERQQTARFFRLLTSAPIDHATGEIAGDLLRQFGKSHNLKIGDALIAATAIQNQTALWTRNRKHYPMPGLTFYS